MNTFVFLQCDAELAIIWETLGVHLETGVPYPPRPNQADLANWANNRAIMSPYQSTSPLWKDMGFQGQVRRWTQRYRRPSINPDASV